MCSLHCRCTEGRKLKVSCVVKHPPQVYSCSWISCLSAPHSTSWSRLEFFLSFGRVWKGGMVPKRRFFSVSETGVFFSMDFLGILQVIVMDFFWGRWWCHDENGSLNGSWGSQFFNKDPRGCRKTAAGAVALASPPCWAVARSDELIETAPWKKNSFLKGFTKGLWNLFNGVSWEDRGILTGL